MFKRKLLSKMGSDGLTVNQALKFNLITTPVPPRFNPYSYTPSNNRGTYEHAFLPPKTPFSTMRESFGVTTQTEQEPIKEENDVVQKEPVKLSMHTTSTHIPPEEPVKLSMHTTSLDIPPGRGTLVKSLNAEIKSLKDAMENLEVENLTLTGKVHTLKGDLMKEARILFATQKKQHLQELEHLQSKVNELTKNLADSKETSEANLTAKMAEMDKALNDEKRKSYQHEQTITALLEEENDKLQKLRATNAKLLKLHDRWNFTVQRYVASMIAKFADPDLQKLLDATPHYFVGSTKVYDQKGFITILDAIFDSDKKEEYLKAIDTFMTNATTFDYAWRIYEQNTKTQQWGPASINPDLQNTKTQQWGPASINPDLQNTKTQQWPTTRINPGLSISIPPPIHIKPTRINPGLSLRIPEPVDVIMRPAGDVFIEPATKLNNSGSSSGSSGSSLSSAPSTGSEPEKKFSAAALKQKAVRRSERTRNKPKPIYKETTNRPSQSKKGKGKK